MNESAYDRVLIALTLLAPLALFALNAWRTSLDVWYAPLDAGDVSYFGEPFTQHLAAWLAGSDESGPRLIVIVDRECPCTTAALRSLDTALAKSNRKNITVDVRYIDGPDSTGNSAAWRALLSELPATPTLLAIQGRQLVYAGPVNSGNLCTTAVERVLGVTALQSPRTSPIVSWLERGCYCRLQEPRPLLVSFSSYLLDVFQRRFTHAAGRLVWYGAIPAGLIDTERVLVHNDRLPEQRTDQFSHMGLLFSPANPVYGEQGDVRVRLNGQRESTMRACEAGAPAPYSGWDTARVTRYMHG